MSGRLWIGDLVVVLVAGRHVGHNLHKLRGWVDRETAHARIADAVGFEQCLGLLFKAGRHGIQIVSLRRIAGALGVAFSALVDDPADQGAPLLTAVPKGAGR